MILPAMGDQRDGHFPLAQAHSSATGRAMSSIAIATISFLVWGHHMFGGQSNLQG